MTNAIPVAVPDTDELKQTFHELVTEWKLDVDIVRR